MLKGKGVEDMDIKDCKIGMKVRCISGWENATLRTGEVYTIDRYDTDSLIFLKEISGGWYPWRFEPVESCQTCKHGSSDYTMYPCNSCRPEDSKWCPKNSSPETPEHYSKGTIQPLDYIQANNLGFCEGNIVKYITRYKYKDGLDDLKKARDYLDTLIKEY